MITGSKDATYISVINFFSDYKAKMGVIEDNNGKLFTKINIEGKYGRNA